MTHTVSLPFPPPTGGRLHSYTAVMRVQQSGEQVCCSFGLCFRTKNQDGDGQNVKTAVHTPTGDIKKTTSTFFTQSVLTGQVRGPLSRILLRAEL